MNKNIATRDAYGKALTALGSEYENIVALDADLSQSTKTAVFAKKFPDRFFNVGIAEQNLMGVAAGLSACGKIPFASTFAMFATGRAFEQVRNSIAYNNLNVKIAATHAGITVGEDGGSHQAIEDISLMRTLPNMNVVVPADAIETEKAMAEIVKIEAPFYLRLGRLAVPQINNENYEFKLGKGTIMRKGNDIALIGCGLMVNACLEAADILAKDNINAMVINMSTIKPIDKDLILTAAKDCGAIVTAEEATILGGLGSAVAETLVENYPVPMARVGVLDTFGESGKPSDLLQKYGLTAGNIVQKTQAVLERK